MSGSTARKNRRIEEKVNSSSGLRPMHISLRSGERLFLNGAVLRVDRKVTLELLNDATFLLENHVLQVEDTTTPLRQLYFAAQAILMDPQNAKASRALFEAMASDIKRCISNNSLKDGIEKVCELVSMDRTFQALKALRHLFAEEEHLMNSAKIENNPPNLASNKYVSEKSQKDIQSTIPPSNFSVGKSNTSAPQPSSTLQ